MRSITGLLLSVAIVLTTAAASAQPKANAIPSSNGDGLDTHLCRPALDSRGLIAVNGVDVLGAGRISLALTLDYGRGLLRVPDVGQQSTSLVRDSFTGTFHFNYGIAERALVGISAPAVLMSGDPQPGVAGWGPQALDVQSIQHLALHGRVMRRPGTKTFNAAAGKSAVSSLSQTPLLMTTLEGVTANISVSGTTTLHVDVSRDGKELGNASYALSNDPRFASDLQLPMPAIVKAGVTYDARVSRPRTRACAARRYRT